MGADAAERHGRHAAGMVTAEQARTDPPAEHTPDGPTGEGAAHGERPHRRRVLRRVLISLGVLTLLLALVIGGGL